MSSFLNLHQNKKVLLRDHKRRTVRPRARFQVHFQVHFWVHFRVHFQIHFSFTTRFTSKFTSGFTSWCTFWVGGYPILVPSPPDVGATPCPVPCLVGRGGYSLSTIMSGGGGGYPQGPWDAPCGQTETLKTPSLTLRVWVVPT